MALKSALPIASATLAPDKQRLDKWLWFARIVKTRKEAVRLIAAGHVRVNARRVEAPAKLVTPGEVLTVALERHVRVLQIVALAERRGGAPQAQALFVDLAETAAPSAPTAT